MGLKSIEDRVTELEAKVLALEKKIDDNTTTTNLIKGDTTEIVGVLNAIKGGAKVLGWLGRPAQAITSLVLLVGLIRGWFTDLLFGFIKWIGGK